jgi:HAD superfamily hydrolase (TIGR01509 family)
MSLPVEQVLERIAEHPLDGDIVTGGVSEDQVRALYAGALGLDESQADAMMAEMWNGYCGELDVELRDFAAALSPTYTTAILSNSADGARREEQRRYGFEELVDTIVYSHEVGLAKPDPAVFRLTERRLSAEAHEIVFLDDHDGHVRAARKLGWHAVHHVSTPRSIQEITRLLS